MNITKFELCNRVAKKLELQGGKRMSSSSLERAFEGFMDEILIALAEGRNLELRGFGSFKTKIRNKRMGRNPRTGKIVEIPPYKAPLFKFSKDGQRIFDEKLNELSDKKKIKHPTKKKTEEKAKDQPQTPNQPVPFNETPESAIKTAESFKL